jgi:hypothetical protein
MQNYAHLSNKINSNLSNPAVTDFLERSKTLASYQNAKSLNDSTLAAIRKYYLSNYSKRHSSAGFPLKPFTGLTPTSGCGFCSPLKSLK